MHPEMRPLGVGEALDAAIAICRRSYWPLVKIAALVMVPVQVLSTLLVLSAGGELTTFTFTTEGLNEPVGDDYGLTVVVTVVVLILSLLAMTIATAASTKLVADTYLAERGSAGESIRYAAHRAWALIGATLVAAVATVAGIYACLIPGVWLAVSWWVFIPILLIEGIGPMASLRRSLALTRARFFSTLGAMFVVFLFQETLSALFDIVGWIVLRSGPFGSGNVVVNSVLQGVATTLTLPVAAAAVVVWYFDLRVRSEGFDISMMIRGLDRAAVATP